MTGDVLRRLRVSAGLRQADLAARAGVSPSAISLIESEAREATPRILRRIAVALGVSPSVLYVGALLLDDPTPAIRSVAERLIAETEARMLVDRMCGSVDAARGATP